MGARRSIAYAAGGLGAAAAAALATGVVVERRVVKARRAGAAAADRLGALRSDPVDIACSDGVVLHAEVDEVAPYAVGKRRRNQDVTVVFVHGMALNLDCWHFQREAFRGKYRMVFYDQRSHGRSGQSEREHATVDQLGDDLARVIETLAPKGRIVLVGHSMGGMSIIAFAERHPKLFARRVQGVALISTTAGGLKVHRTLSRWIPDGIGQAVAPRVIAALAKAPELVDSARRPGSNIGFLVADMFAFGGKDVPAAEVEFLDEMLAGTSFEVLATFFPNFPTLDKFEHLGAFADVETTIICGTKDKVTSIGHSRKMAKLLPNAHLVECEGAGHMVIFESRQQVNAALESLMGVGHVMTEILTVDGSRAADVLAVIHEAFADRPPLDPPATALDETVESVREALDEHGGLLVEHEGAPVGALLLEPRGRLLGLRRVGVLNSVRGLGVAAKMASRAAEIAAARRFGGIELEARVELPKTIEFWSRLGYVESGRNGNRLTMLKMLPITRVLRTADDTHAFGGWLASLLQPSDVVILTGDLGAGKTTLTQGIGEGLGVRGDVTSPTFVIARVHPALTDGPALVHVDAYRLGGAAELDDLDLDTDIEDAVTVIEWGEGLAETLARSRLELNLERRDDDVRTLTLTPVGPRWRELVL